jgi:hypothetical protein
MLAAPGFRKDMASIFWVSSWPTCSRGYLPDPAVETVVPVKLVLTEFNKLHLKRIQ